MFPVCVFLNLYCVFFFILFYGTLWNFIEVSYKKVQKHTIKVQNAHNKSSKKKQ